MPFTDPLADGPINQAAGREGSGRGHNWLGILQMVAKLRGAGAANPHPPSFPTSTPLLAFGDNLIEEAARAGIDGLVIPDLPPEEHSWFAKGESRLPLIGFVSPHRSQAAAEDSLKRSPRLPLLRFHHRHSPAQRTGCRLNWKVCFWNLSTSALCPVLWASASPALSRRGGGGENGRRCDRGSALVEKLPGCG